MGYRSSVSPIHAPPRPYSDESKHTMYSGSPGIISVHLIGSTDASCSSFHILSTNCLTYVNISRFTQDGSRPSTEFTRVNNPLSSGMPIVVWQNLRITEMIVFKYTLSLRTVDFRCCNIFSCLSGASSIHLSAPSKIHPITSFLVSHRTSLFSNFDSNIGSGI